MISYEQAGAGSVVAFIGVLGAVLGMVALGSLRATRNQPAPEQKQSKRFLLGVSAWLVVSSLYVKFLMAPERPIPALPVFFGGIGLVSALTGMSKMGALLSRHLSLGLLVLFQGFRLPLELVLHTWAGRGVIPDTMTWTGQNWDIVTGCLAFLLFPFVDRRPWLGWIFNIVGTGLLLNVMRVAVFSSPLPFAWQIQPPLLLAFFLPFGLIGPVCVAGAIFGHFVLTRALLAEGARSSR